MGSDTKIQWTDATHNSWRGCTKATYVNKDGKTVLHPGCLNCYAEVDMSVKLHGIRWGKGQERRVKAESGWKEPIALARSMAKIGARARVFSASLSDVLDPEGPPAARERLWETIRQTAYCGIGAGGRLERFTPTKPDAAMKIGGLDWQLLTKRPENWRWIPEDIRPLVWLGTSVSDQETADEWVPRLLDADGFRHRFLSVEPLLGPVDLTAIPGEIGVGLHSRDVLRGWNIHHDDGDQYTVEPWTKIGWVIIGGESGRKARPCNVEWIRSIVRQCREAVVPAFCKQLGAVWADETGAMTTNDDGETVKDAKGGDWSNWPTDLRVRQMPGDT